MKQVSISAFDQYIQNPIKDNLFIIYGEERFFHDSLLAKIENVHFENKADRDLNYHIFYGTENSVSDILSACLSFPMLAERKLVVVKEFDGLQITDKDSFLKYITNPQSTTTLVLIAEKFGINKFQKDILAQAVSVQCKNLNPSDIYQWSLEKFKSAKIKADKDSIAFLIENIGANLLRLNLEIEKINNFLGPDEALTLEKVSKITGFTRDVNIFKFQKSLASKNLKTGLKIGYLLLEQGESLAAILPMIFIFFRRIWAVKQLLEKNHSEKQIVGLLGGSGYAYRDIFATHGNFTYEHLQLIFEKILEAEIQLKTTQRAKESIITILSYFICNFKKNMVF
jgi:DNA polymerase-3 subunit delta